MKTYIVILTFILALCTSCTTPSTKVSDINLHTSDKVIRLSEFSNKLILLSFGYTHCPDVCPATLTHVSEALDLLSSDELSRVQPLFISVDPERDSLEKLKEYVGFFHKKIIGASIEPKSSDNFLKGFNIESFRESDAVDYQISHTSYLFLIDDQANILDMMGHQTKPASIAEAIKRKL